MKVSVLEPSIESTTHRCTGLVQEVRHKHKAPNILFTSVHPDFVRTPLLEPYFSTLNTGGKELLEAGDVANAIAEQVLGCSGGQIYLPTGAARTTLVRGWPNWLQEALRGRLAKLILSGTE
jgi:all-trans-retinol dehydrogenase (NAD+)